MGLGKLFVGCAVGVVAFAGVHRTARACTCVGQTHREAYDAADAVFEGRPYDVTDDGRGGPHHDFEVHRTWKGMLPRHSVVYTSQTKCGRRYDLGQTYVVYAHEKGGRLHDNVCSATHPISGPPRVEIEAFGEGTPPRLDRSARGCSVATDSGARAWLLAVLVLLFARRTAPRAASSRDADR